MVWIKRLNTGDPGDSTHVGGAQWDLLDQYHDNVDIGAPVKINTITRYQPNKFAWRDSNDTHDFLVNTADLTANCTINLPSGWPASVTPAVLEDTGQTFLTEQTIERTGSANMLALKRVSSTPGDGNNVNFQALDSLSNVTDYARIRAEIDDSTDASEDGTLLLQVSVNSVMTTMLDMSSAGVFFNSDITTIGGALNIEHNTIAQITADQNNYAPGELGGSSFMRISSNAARNITGLDDWPDRLMVLRNVGSFPITLKNQSASSLAENRFDFGRDIIIGANRSLPIYYDQTTDRWVGLLAGAALIDNPNTFTDLITIQRDGDPSLLDLYRTDNGVGNGIDIDFLLDDSTSAQTKYATVRGEILDATNGSEDGSIGLYVMAGGTQTQMVNVNGIDKQFQIIVDGYDSLDIYRPNNTVDNTPPGISFSKNNSASAKTGIAWIYAGMSVNTAGAEESDFTFFLKRAGANIASMKLTAQGDLELYDPNTASDIYLGNISYKSKDSASNVQDFANFYCFKDDATSASEDTAFGMDNSVAGTIRNTHWFSRGTLGMQDDAFAGVWHYAKTNNIRGTDKTQYYSNGTAYIPCYLDSNGGVSTIISNSSAEQTIYSNTTPQYAMNQNGFLEMTIHGYITQTQATGTTFIFRAKFGGVTMWQDTSISIGQQTVELPFTIIVKVWGKNSETAQGMAGRVYLNDGGAATTGIGDISDDETMVFGNFDSQGNDGTRDTTSGTQSFSVTAQASVASLSVTLVRRHVDLLLVTAG